MTDHPDFRGVERVGVRNLDLKLVFPTSIRSIWGPCYGSCKLSQVVSNLYMILIISNIITKLLSIITSSS